SEYLSELGIKVHYLHSEIETLDRVGILRDLRLGVYDVVVGVNLLREGLDLPEVSLVAILDADKEGFLRSETSLIQMIGRASRNINGKVIMYADTITESMRKAIDETNRRRRLQMEYNEKHGITPETIRKAVHDILQQKMIQLEKEKIKVSEEAASYLDVDYILSRIVELEREMKKAAANLEFERAAQLRDEIKRLKELVAAPSGGGKRG
ncbi:MAG: helicase-related protein, partial [bacterium]